MKHLVRIKPDGTLEFLGPPPDGLRLPEQTRRRFSEIVPCHRWPWHRLAFRVIRFLFGDTGKAAEWTRRWQCLWVCTILEGRHKGEQRWSWERRVLIEWERGIWFSPKVEL